MSEKLLYTNNATTVLSGTLASGATALQVAVGTGSMFPSPIGIEAFLVTLFEHDLGGNETRIEVVKCTGRSGDLLTIVRDVESLTGIGGGYGYPSSVGVTVYVELRWTALCATRSLQTLANLGDLNSASISRANLGLGSVATMTGPSSSIVGTTDTQTLSNKTLTAPIIDGSAPTITGNFHTTGLLLKTNTTDTTRVLIAPKTSTTGSALLTLFGDPDTANTHSLNLYVSSTTARIQGSATGTGTARNIEIQPGNVVAKFRTDDVVEFPYGKLMFPAVQSASADANTLDDYEEGTWTPVIDSSSAGTGRATTVTYASAHKIGNRCFFEAYVTLTTLGSGGSGDWVIKGLPYTSLAGSYAAVTVGYVGTLASNVVFISGTVQPGTTQITLRGLAAAGTSMTNLAFATYVTTNTAVVISGSYVCA